MILKYGSYTHSNNECSLVIERTPLRNQRGFAYGTTERWSISGELIAASQAALTTAIDALETGYSGDGYDLGLYLDDGTTLTSHSLSSSGSISGTRVVKRPSYPKGTGAEYSVFRNYDIAVEADFRDTTGALLQAWVETISFKGAGGAMWRYFPTILGPWQRQDVHQFTPYTAVQRGRAVTLYSPYAVPSPPLWPAAEQRWLRDIERKLPERLNGTLQNYEISWAYFFEAMTPLVGLPFVP